MTHSHHTMHANSLANSNADFSGRERQVIKALHELGGFASDREIAKQMGSEDPNMSRPRVTTLIKKGVLFEVGMKTENRRSVRVVTRYS